MIRTGKGKSHIHKSQGFAGKLSYLSGLKENLVIKNIGKLPRQNKMSNKRTEYTNLVIKDIGRSSRIRSLLVAERYRSLQVEIDKIAKGIILKMPCILVHKYSKF